jgi:hypothetical protein
MSSWLHIGGTGVFFAAMNLCGKKEGMAMFAISNMFLFFFVQYTQSCMAIIGHRQWGKSILFPL